MLHFGEADDSSEAYTANKPLINLTLIHSHPLRYKPLAFISPLPSPVNTNTSTLHSRSLSPNQGVPSQYTNVYNLAHHLGGQFRIHSVLTERVSSLLLDY